MKDYRLEVLTTAELFDVRDYADRLIKQRVKKERREIERTLARISKVADEQRPVRGRVSSLKGTKVQPKYRNRQTGETWSGRGATPRWLKPLLEQGRKLHEFAIGGQAEPRGSTEKRQAARGRNRKTGRANKKPAATRLARSPRKPGEGKGNAS